jgi:hypothetical protein
VKSPFDTDDDSLARGRDGLEKRFWGGWPVPVHQHLPNLVQEAEVHGAGVQVDTTVTLVLLGVKSPEVASASGGCVPNASIPRWYAEAGASISIKALQPTPYSVRSCVAPAFGSG